MWYSVSLVFPLCWSLWRFDMKWCVWSGWPARSSNSDSDAVTPSSPQTHVQHMLGNNDDCPHFALKTNYRACWLPTGTVLYINRSVCFPTNRHRLHQWGGETEGGDDVVVSHRRIQTGCSQHSCKYHQHSFLLLLLSEYQRCSVPVLCYDSHWAAPRFCFLYHKMCCEGLRSNCSSKCRLCLSWQTWGG